MKSVIFILFIPFFLTAMEPQSLAVRIKDNKKLYLRTFNDSNPVIQNLRQTLTDLKADNQRQEQQAPAPTFASDSVLIQKITALEEAKILLGACMKEIKDLDEIIVRKGEGITMQQQSALAYKMNAEQLEKDLKEINEKNIALTNAMKLINEKSLQLEIEHQNLISSNNKAIFYRNFFAAGFFISAVGCLGLLFFKK